MFLDLTVAELVNIAIISLIMDFWLCYQAGFRTDPRSVHSDWQSAIQSEFI